MIPPTNSRLKLFHYFLSILFYADIFLTSMCIASHHFKASLDKDFMDNKIVFSIIQIFCLLEIIVNFFTIEKIDITIWSKPEEVALRYV